APVRHGPRFRYVKLFSASASVKSAGSAEGAMQKRRNRPDFFISKATCKRYQIISLDARVDAVVFLRIQLIDGRIAGLRALAIAYIFLRRSSWQRLYQTLQSLMPTKEKYGGPIRAESPRIGGWRLPCRTSQNPS